MSILIKNVSKSFGNFRSLDNISLEVRQGTLLALLGPSGSGKTTLLRIIAGLEVADSGSVHYDGEDITHRSARDRKIGFVFQHYALFRHMTVADNIGYGLRVRNVPKARVRERVDELLRLIRLDGLETRYPGQLSGGQRQRVALARALAAQPRVLLLDEPFGALDAKVRQELRRWLRRLHDEIQITSVFVTHDQEEALEVADRIVVMNDGKIEQEGTPEEIFECPRTPFVMSFLGEVNTFHGRVQNGRAIFPGMETAFPEHQHANVKAARAYARPHELDIQRSRSNGQCLPATVRHVNPAGAVAKVELVLVDQETLVQANLSRERYLELQLRQGDAVFVVPRQLRIFIGEDRLQNAVA
jgi:sulfate transport system ATP-binding protein